VGRSKKLKREPVTKPTTVYRVVRVDRIDRVALEDSFCSERQLGVTDVTEREEEHPELLDGMCMDTKPEQAAKQLLRFRSAASREGEPEPKRGNFVAKLVLGANVGFECEKRKRSDGKCTVWGARAKCAGAVVRIYRVDATGNLEVADEA
jgi:hypothetical protein